MKSIHYLFLAFLPFVAVGSVAEHAQAATCDGNSCTGNIVAVSVNAAGHSFGATVRLDSNVAPSGCSLSGSEWLVTANSSDLIRTLVAAHVAGRKVSLRRADATPTCTVDYVSVW
jgi:hypothetical protein